jgi:hypothetical protein
VGPHNTYSKPGTYQRSTDNPATLRGSYHRNAVTSADDARAICGHRSPELFADAYRSADDHPADFASESRPDDLVASPAAVGRVRNGQSNGGADSAAQRHSHCGTDVDLREEWRCH